MNNTVLSLEYKYDDESTTLFVEFIEDEKFNVEEFVENKMLITQYVKELRPKEQQIIKLRYYDGFSMSEIADMFHMTKNGIYLLEKRVLQKLKKMIGSDDYETSMDFKKRA